MLLSRSLSTLVILALALAVITAWARHTYSLSVPDSRSHSCASARQGTHFPIANIPDRASLPSSDCILTMAAQRLKIIAT